jgi:hypothetical protein
MYSGIITLLVIIYQGHSPNLPPVSRVSDRSDRWTLAVQFFREEKFKLVVSPIHPPLGDIKIFSGCGHVGSGDVPLGGSVPKCSGAGCRDIPRGGGVAADGGYPMDAVAYQEATMPTSPGVALHFERHRPWRRF